MRRGPSGVHATVGLLAAVALLLAVPAAASAGFVIGDRPSDELDGAIFVAKRGEANDVSVSVSSNGRRLVVLDRGAPLEARGRCRGGGSGEPARCRIPRDHLGFYAALRDGDDRFDATALPRRHGHGARPRPTNVHVSGEAGDDMIAAGPSWGDIEPGFGDDIVRAGAGGDRLLSEDAPDGADVLDGGRGLDQISYMGRDGDIAIDLGSAAAVDGESGEGDSLVSFENVESGGGNDLLIGSSAAERLVGGGGDDRVYGGGGNDRLIGDGFFRGGDDRLDGGAGNDKLWGELGRDRLLGGSGRDRIDSASSIFLGFHGRDRARDRVNCGSGKDRVKAEPRDRLARCEQVRRTRR